MVSVWDTFGNRLTTCVLSGAGSTGESSYSFSYCNGKVFVVDSSTGFWRGYDVGSTGRAAIYGAPSTPSWNGDVQSKILGTKLIPEVDTNLVFAPNPMPTLTNLIQYESVLLYSDSAFGDPTNLGNTLATYINAGGGVVLATFGFSTGIGIQGALTTDGDLPFTQDGQASGTTQTLVEDVPTHQIFSGVASFNGGQRVFRTSSPSRMARRNWDTGAGARRWWRSRTSRRADGGAEFLSAFE